MRMDFFDCQHAQQYLSQSIVRRLNGDPVMIDEVSGRDGQSSGWSCNYSLLYNRSHGDCLVKNLNLDPLPLGFLNYIYEHEIRDCAYIYRYPRRGWKVGLSLGAMGVHGIRGDDPDSIFHFLRPVDLAFTKSFHNMVKGSYPSYEEALKMVEGHNFKSVAFSKRFGITAKGALHYKMFRTPVGKTTKDRPVLEEPYLALYEQLQEDSRARPTN